MPIFEYRCRDCEAKFEMLVFSSGTEVICDKCGSSNAEKLISGFATAGNASTSSNSCSGSGKFT